MPSKPTERFLEARLAMLKQELATVERARCIGYLASVSLKAIEAGNLAARIEELEAILKRRENEAGNR